jgi:hypothetical protein
MCVCVTESVHSENRMTPLIVYQPNGRIVPRTCIWVSHQSTRAGTVVEINREKFVLMKGRHSLVPSVDDAQLPVAAGCICTPILASSLSAALWSRSITEHELFCEAYVMLSASTNCISPRSRLHYQVRCTISSSAANYSQLLLFSATTTTKRILCYVREVFSVSYWRHFKCVPLSCLASWLSNVTFVHKVPRLIPYLGLGKC